MGRKDNRYMGEADATKGQLGPRGSIEHEPRVCTHTNPTAKLRRGSRAGIRSRRLRATLHTDLGCPRESPVVDVAGPEKSVVLKAQFRLISSDELNVVRLSPASDLASPNEAKRIDLDN